MSDREALLAAIRANPDDDLPRLVYADWLEENASEVNAGGERAAFIRAQVEAARAEPFSVAARTASEQAGQLLHSVNREFWTEHLRGQVLDAAFERGFIEHVMVDAASFSQDADTLFVGHRLPPSIRSVRTTDRGGRWPL